MKIQLLILVVVSTTTGCTNTPNSRATSTNRAAPRAQTPPRAAAVPQGKAAFTPGRLTAVQVWAHPTFPPKAVARPVRFKLTAAELAQVKTKLPPFGAGLDHSCDCGVPRFGIQLHYANQVPVKGHFFHGQDTLVLSFPNHKQLQLTGLRPLHRYLVSILKARGYWKP